MSDYIKRDDAIKYNESQVNFCKQEGFPNPEWLHIDSIKNIIKLIPAADVVEQKHGKWKKAYLDHEAFGIRPTVVYCSECNLVGYWEPKYCPNCGARMVEE